MEGQAPFFFRKKKRDLINEASEGGNTINVFGRSLFCSLSESASVASLRWHFYFLLAGGVSFILKRGLYWPHQKLEKPQYVSSEGIFSSGSVQGRYGLNYVRHPEIHMVKPQPQTPQNVTWFGDKAFK